MDFESWFKQTYPYRTGRDTVGFKEHAHLEYLAEALANAVQDYFGERITWVDLKKILRAYRDAFPKLREEPTDAA